MRDNTAPKYTSVDRCIRDSYEAVNRCDTANVLENVMSSTNGYGILCVLVSGKAA